MTNTTGPSPRRIDVRGAVDLGALAARRPAPSAGPGGSAPGGAGSVASDGAATAAAGSFVIEVTEATFAAEVVERSAQVPVILDFWATWCGPCKQLSPLLEKLAAENEGRFLLATVDVDANPQLAQMFQVQSIPTVYALIGRQPVPLFQGAQPEAQLRQVVAEVLRVAAENGVTGTLTAAGPVESTDGEVDEPEDEALPPLHQAAYDAIEAGDLAAAVQAYEQALTEEPGDQLAKVGLAQVRLLQRAEGVDPVVVRAAAAAAPTDVDAQLTAADLDVMGGHVEDAFARLVDTVRATSGADRDRTRARLIELFEIVGSQDPRVGPARLALANALF